MHGQHVQAPWTKRHVPHQPGDRERFLFTYTFVVRVLDLLAKPGVVEQSWSADADSKANLVVDGTAGVCRQVLIVIADLEP